MEKLIFYDNRLNWLRLICQGLTRLEIITESMAQKLTC